MTDEPVPVADLIRELRARGLSHEAIARALNSDAIKRWWPPPVGTAAWTGLLVRVTLEESRS